jgi:hypothetical protein
MCNVSHNVCHSKKIGPNSTYGFVTSRKYVLKKAKERKRKFAASQAVETVIKPEFTHILFQPPGQVLNLAEL